MIIFILHMTNYSIRLMMNNSMAGHEKKGPNKQLQQQQHQQKVAYNETAHQSHSQLAWYADDERSSGESMEGRLQS